jgi:hypothetical protein
MKDKMNGRGRGEMREGEERKEGKTEIKRHEILYVHCVAF